MILKYYFFSSSLFFSCNGEDTPSKNDTTDTVEEIPNEDSAENTTDPEDTSEEEIPSNEECSEDIVGPLSWFESMNTNKAEGNIYFGQTHVVEKEEQRWAPPLISQRATSIFFEPDRILEQDTDMRISAWSDNDLIGIIQMVPPNQKPAILEQQLTISTLESWKENIWSALLPWEWMVEDVELRIGFFEEEEYFETEHLLQNVGAPHTFHLTRSKIILFGDENDPVDTTTLPASQLLYDYFAVYPTSMMKITDSLPWYLPRVVINSDSGPILVHSEDERLEYSSDNNRWSILKNQFTLRMSLANTGRGLTQLNLSDGDNSPYSFGTSIGLGWVKNNDGSYSDINNAPYAAGWTGWSALWLGECGNVFIHEVGHSATLAHFSEGVASMWGIEDQYPNDGTHIESHPWGYDTLRNQFRTWYRVDNSGIVYTSDGRIQGKRDPMNGGESSNSITCFPQYIPYQAWQIQKWIQDSPTLDSTQNEVIQWDNESNTYQTIESPEGANTPLEIGVPIATLIGTLGSNDEVNQIYPPIFTSSGNTFEFIHPTDPQQDEYEGAVHFLKINYENGSSDLALINKEEIVDTNLYVFSLNIALENHPTDIELYRTSSGYPNMDIESANILHHEEIDIPAEALPTSFIAGQGFLANGKIQVQQFCEPGINCDSRTSTSMWRNPRPLSFHTNITENIDNCTTEDETSILEIPVANEEGQTDVMILHAQRTVQSGSENWKGVISDGTNWIQRPNLEQGLVVWAPYEENKELSSGIWKSVEDSTLIVLEEGQEWSKVKLTVEINKPQIQEVNLQTPFQSVGVTAEDSSVYFLLQEDQIGPTSRVWWGDANAIPLNIPVIDQSTNERTHLVVQAKKRSCDMGWGEWWTLNSGQSADGSCEHAIYLEISMDDNTHLMTGHTYKTPNSEPVAFEARRWHDPNAEQIIESFYYLFTYTVE